jgi:peptide/nickel transport system substrate-binding protein
MRTDKPPFTDNNVRLALKYAIDREEIIKKILGGYGSVGNDHPISSSYKFFDPDLPIRQYDPDKAKFHLKQAKMEDYQFTLNVADAPFPGAVDTAILYQQHAAKAGIKIKVVREPNDGYWSNVWMKKAWTASAWSGRITEDIMFSQAYASGVPWNETFWKNERFDELLVKARTERDEAERRAMYHEMQRLVRDDGGALIMMFSDQVLGIRSRVKHGKLSGAYQLDGNRAHERWWFES